MKAFCLWSLVGENSVSGADLAKIQISVLNLLGKKALDVRTIFFKRKLKALGNCFATN